MSDNYKMVGIDDICSRSKTIDYTSGHYLEIGYDPNDGGVYGEEFEGTPGKYWTCWRQDIIRCGYIDKPKTPQQIVEQIEYAIEHINDNYTTN